MDSFSVIYWIFIVTVWAIGIFFFGKARGIAYAMKEFKKQ